MSEDTSTFILGTVIGGVISGVVGIAVAHYIKETQEKESLKQNVYRPLYNQISLITERQFLTEHDEDPWKKLDNYSRFQTKPSVQSLFEKYSLEFERWQKVRKGLEQFFADNIHEFDEIFKSVFSDNGLLTEDKQMIRLDKRSSQQVATWINYYRQVLFSSYIESPSKLNDVLVAFAGKTEHSVWLCGFKERAPHFYDNLFEKVREVRARFEIDSKMQEMEEQQERVLSVIREIKPELEKKIK